MRTYTKINTGEVFTGELPKEVSIPVSEQINESLSVTKLVTATEGDADYQDVLDAFMFMQGYSWQPD